MESSSSSDNESSLGFRSSNETYIIKSSLTISLPPDAASYQMNASAPHIDDDEPSAFLQVDGADGTHYHEQAISEAGNASLGCLESPTPNDELAEQHEFDKRSAAAAEATTRTLFGRRDLSTPQTINWEAAKSEEISRLRADIKQLKAEQLENFGRLSEANDSVARLRDENSVLKSQQTEERQFLERMETTMVDAKQQLSLERIKAAYSEEETDHLRKHNRRLVREVDFAKSDLSVAERELKASKVLCASLQRDLRDVGCKLKLVTNKLYLTADEEALLKNEIATLNKSLSDAHGASTVLRHENTQLQDKLAEQRICLEKQQLEVQTLQGHFTKQLNSLGRQLASAREQVNECKLQLAERSTSSELHATRRKYDELKKVFQMQVAGGEHVSHRTRRSRSVTRSSVCHSSSEEEVRFAAGKDAIPQVTQYVRQLEDENRMLRMRIQKAKDLARDEG